jgi:nucleotide-binding universal stress UspA family protein
MKRHDARARLQLKNILYCTDFSPAADAAFPYATELARHFGARLHALHVRNPDDYIIVFPEGGSIPPGFTVEQATKKLNGLLEPFSDIDRVALVEEGTVWSTIASVIDKSYIDLIVVGTRGRGGLTKLVLGSQAEQIFRRARCPVLTVGPHSAPLRHDGSAIQRILYATDFTSESAAAAPYAVSLAEEYEASLTLLHVIVDPKTLDLVRPQELGESPDRLLRNLVPPEVESRRLDYVVERGAAADEILEVAARRHVDLIVLGIRQPSGLPGAATHMPTATAHKIVSRANCPVLTIRA